MIKLTYKEYKPKESALKRLHNVEEEAQEEMSDWARRIEENKIVDEHYYEPKPYIPIFEFEDEDYDLTTGPFRIAKEDIKRYKVNIDGDLEIYTSWGTIVSVEEKLEYLDGFFFDS